MDGNIEEAVYPVLGPEKKEQLLSQTEVQILLLNNVCYSFLLYSVFCLPGMDCAVTGGDLFGQRTDG